MINIPIKIESLFIAGVTSYDIYLNIISLQT